MQLKSVHPSYIYPPDIQYIGTNGHPKWHIYELLLNANSNPDADKETGLIIDGVHHSPKSYSDECRNALKEIGKGRDLSRRDFHKFFVVVEHLMQLQRAKPWLMGSESYGAIYRLMFDIYVTIDTNQPQEMEHDPDGEFDILQDFQQANLDHVYANHTIADYERIKERYINSPEFYYHDGNAYAAGDALSDPNADARQKLALREAFFQDRYPR